MYHHSYLVLPPPRWGRVGVGVMRAECVDPVENRSNFPKLIFIVVIENEDVIMDLLAAVREAAKLIEAAQGPVHGLATARRKASTVAARCSRRCLPQGGAEVQRLPPNNEDLKSALSCRCASRPEMPAVAPQPTFALIADHLSRAL